MGQWSNSGHEIKQSAVQGKMQHQIEKKNVIQRTKTKKSGEMKFVCLVFFGVLFASMEWQMAPHFIGKYSIIDRDNKKLCVNSDAAENEENPEKRHFNAIELCKSNSPTGAGGIFAANHSRSIQSATETSQRHSEAATSVHHSSDVHCFTNWPYVLYWCMVFIWGTKLYIVDCSTSPCVFFMFLTKSIRATPYESHIMLPPRAHIQAEQKKKKVISFIYVCALYEYIQVYVWVGCRLCFTNQVEPLRKPIDRLVK